MLGSNREERHDALPFEPRYKNVLYCRVDAGVAELAYATDLKI